MLGEMIVIQWIQRASFFCLAAELLSHRPVSLLSLVFQDYFRGISQDSLKRPYYSNRMTNTWLCMYLMEREVGDDAE